MCNVISAKYGLAPGPNSLWLAGRGVQEGLPVLDGSNRGGDSLRSHTGLAARSCNLSMSERT